MYVCLWSPDWSTGGASAAEAGASHDAAVHLAGLAPRLRVEREVVWADGRGLDAAALARRLVGRAVERGVVVRAGVAAVPVTAELAARWGPRSDPGSDGPTPFLVKERTGWGRRTGGGSGPSEPSRPAAVSDPRSPFPGDGGAEVGPPGREGGVEGTPAPDGAGVVVVERGGEVEWQEALPITALRPPDRVRTLMEGVGLKTLGALAALEREAVEVRFGGGAVSLWRQARADDRRLLFDRIPPERPGGSMDFVDYVLTDPSRLLFTANALLAPLCDGLLARGEHARTLELELPLANGETWARTLRPARPTASRDTWLRLIRGLLDRLTVPDAVAGMRIEIPSTEAAGVRQGDLFDRGFATASAVEAAVARLAERQLWPVLPETDGDPRVERRGGWRRQALTEVAGAHRESGGGGREPRGLTLQLLGEPRRIVVETRGRRDHEVPVRLRDRQGWRQVLLATGPDRISGGQWEASSYAREYYRCVTGEGVPLWIYRDALDGGWYLHGWWD